MDVFLLFREDTAMVNYDTDSLYLIGVYATEQEAKDKTPKIKTRSYTSFHIKRVTLGEDLYEHLGIPSGNLFR